MLPGERVWVGVASERGRYRTVFGTSDGSLLRPAGARHRDDLLSVALAYFTDELAEPPSGLEATQADIGDLLRWLAGTESDRGRRRLLQEAVDAVDDGLPAEVVLARLAAAQGSSASQEPVDAVDRLKSRYRSLLGEP
jgi:hypothetical protein